MSLRTLRTAVGVVAALAATAVAVPAATAATAPAAKPAAAAHKPSVPALKLHLFASAPAGYTNPDDLTRLGDVLYVAYQNNAGPDGSPAGSKSDIVGFDLRTGKVVRHWTLPGRVDGLTADPRHQRLLVTVNEDLNSSFYTITPTRRSATIEHYHYSPSPAQKGSDGVNGGTDAISVAADGTIYVAHSNPDVSLPGANNAPAAYTVTLHGTTAKLAPVFGVADTARVINRAKGAPATEKLGLTDPDSNRWIPGPRGGVLIQDAQADSKLVLVGGLKDKHHSLAVLNLVNAGPTKATATPQLDDIVLGGGDGVLFVVDQKGGRIYEARTEGVRPGTLFASQPAPGDGDLPNVPALSVVDPRTGVVTAVNTGAVKLSSPKGLLFVGADGRD
ncbi:hypothetical protein [Streptacidiphilus jiangxiensis]|uniref:Uncharacterized protein n=1 Tax=Streptacidiphilus jiangxiensis TaxID=235985 RepID=A0A1H7V7V5_STRJI|nr:hypothetical protein [Streptacidiphilus jiangxiensis]SEM05119.1 hypothetical protein SAMN05414137_117138 [Streptacidiphilus jiangxiensis]